MKIELSENQIKFIIRALVNNYALHQSDLEPGVLKWAGNNEQDLIIEDILSQYPKGQILYQEAVKCKYKNKPFNQKLFMGAGYFSICDLNVLHKRLNFAAYELGGLQQGLLSDDPKISEEAIKNIKDVLIDIVFAFNSFDFKDEFVNQLQTLILFS